MPVGWAGGGAGHVEEGVGAALGFGAAQFRDVDVAVTEAVDGVVPVLGEFLVGVPAEDLEEFGDADVVEAAVQGPEPSGSWWMSALRRCWLRSVFSAAPSGSALTLRR